MIVDVSYVGNALRNGYGQMYDCNARRAAHHVEAVGMRQPHPGRLPAGAVHRPDQQPGQSQLLLHQPDPGHGRLQDRSGTSSLYTQSYTNNYNSLQVQLNRRKGKVQWNVNYTFSRTIVYNNAGVQNLFQFVNAKLMKNVANRRHAVNFNFGYDFPTVGQRFSGDTSKKFAKVVLDGWHINGNGAIYAGTPYTVGCGATGQPAQFWTGTPTAYMPVPLPDGKQHLHYGRLAAFEDRGSAAAGSPQHRELHASAGQLAGHRQHARCPCSTVPGCGTWTSPSPR